MDNIDKIIREDPPIEERVKGKSPIIEKIPSYQPPNVKPYVYAFKRKRKGVVIRQQDQQSPPHAQLPPSPPPVQQVPSSLADNVIDLDSPPRDPSPKRRRAKKSSLVDYLITLEEEDDYESIGDDVFRIMPSP